MRHFWLAVTATFFPIFIVNSNAKANVYIPSYSEFINWTSNPININSVYSPSDLQGFASVNVTISGSVVLNLSTTPALVAIAFPNGTLTGNPQAINNPALQTYYNNNILTPYNNIINQAPGAPVYTGVQPVVATITINGLNIIGSFAANSNTFNFSIPALTRFGAGGFQLSDTGATRTIALQNFSNTQLSQAVITELEQSVLGYWAATNPNDPLAGNPTSVQGILVRNALDLSVDDSVIDEGAAGHVRTGNAGNDAGSWMVGAAYGHAYDYGSHTDHLDASIEKSWRVFEGNRSRLKVSIPVSYSNSYGIQEFQGGASLGLEVPVIDDRWSVEPRISWGATAANKIESMGHLAEATVTSRYRIDGIGRGYFIVGNMVGYTETLSTQAFGQDLNPHLRNWVFRNGVAYEMPLKMMEFGRGLSVRGSFVETNYTGSPLFLPTFQEASLSVGVRSREGELHNSYEMLRIGVNGIWGRNYNLINTSIGFRF